jgi:hypothetical protein
MRWGRMTDLQQAEDSESSNAGDPNRETQKKGKIDLNPGGTTDPKQKMGWAQTNLIEKGWEGGGGSRQGTETDPALDLTQREKLLQKGRPGKKKAKGKDKTCWG